MLNPFLRILETLHLQDLNKKIIKAVLNFKIGSLKSHLKKCMLFTLIFKICLFIIFFWMIVRAAARFTTDIH